jgi:hypothetical protein
MKLESHPTLVETEGEAILIYQAQVRREWYDALKSTNDAEAFDISAINTRHIEIIRRSFWDAREAEVYLRSVASYFRTSTITNELLFLI